MTTFTDYLLPIVDTGLILPPTNGELNFLRAGRTFVSSLDNNYVNWGLNFSDKPTNKAPFMVYKLIKNGNFEQIYNSFALPLNELCMTQHQIITFCLTFPEKLVQEEYFNFFLSKKDGVGHTEYFVTQIAILNERLANSVRLISLPHVWLKEYDLRFIVPQVQPSSRGLYSVKTKK